MILSLGKLLAAKTIMVTLLVAISMVGAAEVMTCESDTDCRAVSAYDVCLEVSGETEK